MPVSCATNDLIDGAKCFQQCIPQGMQLAVQTYLLAVIAGGTLDPRELANQARCFNNCLSVGEQLAIQSYLLCQIANA
jgi:hypothetical protein